MTSPATLSLDEVVDFVRGFLRDQGFGEPDVRPESTWLDLGLDSLTVVVLLMSAKSELSARGYVIPPVDPDTAPPIYAVRDLAALLDAARPAG